MPAALFAALCAALGAIAHWRYAIFRYDVDLGIFTQIIASTGRGFSSTAEGSVDHLLVHWSPIVVAAWPALRLFGPAGLEYFQVVAVCATLFPVWGLARRRFGPNGATAVLAVAAIYPILWANAVADFHEMAFVPVLCATLVYAADRRQWPLAAATAALLLCTKEDQFVVLAINGALFAVTAGDNTGQRRAGWIAAGCAVAAALAYFGIVRPALNPQVPYLSLHFFDWRGSTEPVTEVLLTRSRYAVVILAPLAFLPLISRYGLFLIPGLLEIFASREPVALAPGAHYSALLTGYALVAFVDGAARLQRYRPNLARVAVAVAGAVALAIGIFASPMEYWYYLYRRPNAHDARLEAALRRLPPDAAVGAEDEIFAHLGLDRNASVNFHGQPWFVYDITHYSQRWHDVDEAAVRDAVAGKTYAVIAGDDGIVVLRRVRR